MTILPVIKRQLAYCTPPIFPHSRKLTTNKEFNWLQPREAGSICEPKLTNPPRRGSQSMGRWGQLGRAVCCRDLEGRGTQSMGRWDQLVRACHHQDPEGRGSPLMGRCHPGLLVPAIGARSRWDYCKSTSRQIWDEAKSKFWHQLTWERGQQIYTPRKPLSQTTVW